MTFPPQPKPGTTTANNQPVGNAGQSQGFPPVANKGGSGKKSNSDSKNAAIARRMNKNKKNGKKPPFGRGSN